MMLLKANLSTDLFLQITVDNVYSDDSEEKEDFLFVDHRLARGGGRHAHDYDRDGDDF